MRRSKRFFLSLLVSASWLFSPNAFAASVGHETFFRCSVAQHTYEEETTNDEAIRFAESRFSNPACNEEGINLNPEGISFDSCNAGDRCQAICGSAQNGQVRLWNDRVLPAGQSAPATKAGSVKVTYTCSREVEYLCKCN